MKYFAKASLLLIALSIFIQTKSQDTANENMNDSIVPKTNRITFQQNHLQAIPFQDVGSIVLSAPNTYSLKGDNYFFDGIQAGEGYMFIDGMQVNDGESFLFRAIEKYNYYRLNQPISYGNVPSGLVEIKTRSFADSLYFEGEVRSAYDKAYKNLFYELLIGGPISFKKKGERTWKRRPSFLISGSFNSTNDPNPSWEDKYIISPETQANLNQYPLRPTGLASNGTYLNSEFTMPGDFNRVNVHQNAGRKTRNFYGKMQIPIKSNIELTIGSYYKNDEGKEYNFNNALFNSGNNPITKSRQIDNYLNWNHRFLDTKELKADYSVHFQYSNHTYNRQNEKHKDQWFNYGYLGKFTTHKMATYQPGSIEIDGVYYENAMILNSHDFDTSYTFQAMGLNPEMERFTEMIYELYPDKDGNWMNQDQFQSNGGLLNGQSPNSVYGLWSSHGDVSPPSFFSPPYLVTQPYGEGQREHYRGTFQLDLQYKKHNFKLGFEYSKKIERSYQMNPDRLWEVMRGNTNFHILSLDIDNPTPVFRDGVFMDTILFNRKYDANSQFAFDKNLRRKLGLNIDGTDFILTDSYDMINNTIQYYDKDGNLLTVNTPENLYNLDMFNPGLLIDIGVVGYNGYNYDGSKSKLNNDYYRFYKDGTSNPYVPIYSSFYIEDDFQFKDFSVRLGLKLDYFNANQPVMKDKYSLYETLKKGEVSEINEISIEHPSNIGDDYVVYVDNLYNPTIITGYRDGDNWYGAEGEEIQDPYLLDAGSGVSPYLKYPDVRIGMDTWQPEMSFESYKPVYSFLPQVNLNYKFWEMNAYANYNTFSVNPSYLNVFRPEDYLMMRIVDNPSLKPYHIQKINFGANINVYKSIYYDVSVQKMILSDYFAIHNIAGAHPYDYYTIDNYDKNIEVNSLTAMIMFVPRESVGWSGNVSITPSDINIDDRWIYDAPYIILNGNLNFDFGYGQYFLYPQSKILKGVLEGFNIGLFYQNRSGTVLPTVNPSQKYNYSPDFSFFNLRAEKGFYIKNAGLYIGAYVWVENLFDKQNLYYIDPNTGEPDNDGYLSDPNWQQEIENQLNPDSYRWLYQQKLRNPDYYAKPRMVRLGIVAKF
ncbi:MAG: hypothetical protein DRJ05_09010 [Bacteroidetes bacterium]|nr:MAG: hypothetical protein DRJ05_09010 [Bacteroidota bacterium]